MKVSTQSTSYQEHFFDGGSIQVCDSVVEVTDPVDHVVILDPQIGERSRMDEVHAQADIVEILERK